MLKSKSWCIRSIRCFDASLLHLGDGPNGVSRSPSWKHFGPDKNCSMKKHTWQNRNVFLFFLEICSTNLERLWLIEDVLMFQATIKNVSSHHISLKTSAQLPIYRERPWAAKISLGGKQVEPVVEIADPWATSMLVKTWLPKQAMHTLDGRNPAITSWYVKHPIITHYWQGFIHPRWLAYKVSYIPGGFLAGFLPCITVSRYHGITRCDPVAVQGPELRCVADWSG